MVNRIRKVMDERDQGFTLIELLVVIIIIGILAAIAIPVFLNQRKKGVDASLKSDLKNAATQVETWAVDNPASAVSAGSASTTGAGVVTAGTGALAGFRASPGNTVTLVASTGTTGGYCIFAYNTGATNAKSATAQMWYDNDGGGIQSAVAATTTCA